MVQTGQAVEEGSPVGRVSSSQVSVLQDGQGHPMSGLRGSGAPATGLADLHFILCPLDVGLRVGSQCHSLIVRDPLPLSWESGSLRSGQC